MAIPAFRIWERKAGYRVVDADGGADMSSSVIAEYDRHHFALRKHPRLY